MKPSHGNLRSVILIGFLFLGISVIIALTDRAPLYPPAKDTPYTLESLFDKWVHDAVEQTLPGPFAYRVMVPYAIYFTEKATSITGITIDFGLKVLFLTLLQYSFFRYLKLHFSASESLLGVFLLDSYLTATFSNLIGPTVIETGDILNAVVFCVALHAIYQKQFVLLVIVLFLGMLNRETPILLLPFIAMSEWPKKPKASHLIGIILALAIPYFGLRTLIDSPRPVWWTTDALGMNIPFLSSDHTPRALVANFRLIFFLGPLIALGAYKFQEHPRFLRLSWVILPFYIVVHYVVGMIIELRLWTALLVVIIPLAVGGLIRLLGSETR